MINKIISIIIDISTHISKTMGSLIPTPQSKREPEYIYDHIPANCPDYEQYKLTGKCNVARVNFSQIEPNIDIPMDEVDITSDFIKLLVPYCPSRWYCVSKEYKQLAKNAISSSQFIRYQWDSGAMLAKAELENKYEILNVFLECKFPEEVIHYFNLSNELAQKLIIYNYDIPVDKLLSTVKYMDYRLYVHRDLAQVVNLNNIDWNDDYQINICKDLIEDCNMDYARHTPDTKHNWPLKLMVHLRDYVLYGGNTPLLIGKFHLLKHVIINRVIDLTREASDFNTQISRILRINGVNAFCDAERKKYSPIVEKLISMKAIDVILEIAKNKNYHFDIMLTMFYMQSSYFFTEKQRETITECLKRVEKWNVSKDDMNRLLNDDNRWIYDYCSKD